MSKDWPHAPSQPAPSSGALRHLLPVGEKREFAALSENPSQFSTSQPPSQLFPRIERLDRDGRIFSVETRQQHLQQVGGIHPFLRK